MENAASLSFGAVILYFEKASIICFLSACYMTQQKVTALLNEQHHMYGGYGTGPLFRRSAIPKLRYSG